MKKKTKDKLTRIVSIMMAITLVLTMAVTADMLYDRDVASAWESDLIGTSEYETEAAASSTGATLTLGTTYTFAGYSWVAAEVGSGYAILQSTGVTTGAYPGGMGVRSLAGENLYTYNSDTMALYNKIKATEYTQAIPTTSTSGWGGSNKLTRGSGLYLVSSTTAMKNTTSANYAAAFLKMKEATGNDTAWLGDYGTSIRCYRSGSMTITLNNYNYLYKQGGTEAALNCDYIYETLNGYSYTEVSAPVYAYISTGRTSGLQTALSVIDSDNAIRQEINTNMSLIAANHPNYDLAMGQFNSGYTGAANTTAIRTFAPAFCVDTTKIKLSGTEIEVGIFSESDGIDADQLVTTGAEGSTVDLAGIFDDVHYVGGSNDGRSAQYRVTADMGTVSGTTWTLPSGISTETVATLTIKDSVDGVNLFTKDFSFAITPRPADHITVEKLSAFPEFVMGGNSVDLTGCIKVTGYDSGSDEDGFVTEYVMTCPDGTFNGMIFTADDVSSKKTATITITAAGSIGDVDYNGKSCATLAVQLKPDTVGWTNREEDIDTNKFHTCNDTETGIEWKYKYNDDGNIQYLYTESDISGIISDGRVLLVPSAINGIQVVGIGGGTADDGEHIIPFVPANSNKNTWTSIYIPSSVTSINDGAFEGNTASAKIVIPGTVKRIGVDAFKGSNITSAIFNDANSLYINTRAFADIPVLEKVSFRGNGVTIGQKAFANDTGLTAVDIPNGTRFVGEEPGSQDNSYAFAGTSGITLVKIDADTVYSNIFENSRSIAKVVFGENVGRVKYDWSGTAESNAETLASTASRTTYSLNADTVFEMDKTSGGSPFGYAGTLTVVGKDKDINGDTNGFDDTGNPVKAKIAWLATAASDTAANRYAKGTATSIRITAEAEPGNNSGVTETITTQQTGIEAYYSGIIFNNKKLQKEKMTVYKMFDTVKNGSYESDEFYVLRTNDADALLEVDNTNEKNTAGVYVTTYTESVLETFAAKDSITITGSDVAAGTVDVKVVYLQKDADGRILVNHANGHVVAFVYTVAVPVKEYTAENDFFENYGSYSAVISEINGLRSITETLNANISNLNGLISEKNTEISALGDRIAAKNGDIAALTAQKTVLEQEKTSLLGQKSELEAELSKAALDYDALIRAFAELVGVTEISKDNYTYTDKTTGKTYVYINGMDMPYDKTSGTPKTLADGSTVMVYEGTGDVDGTGSSKFWFYIGEDGVHYITLDQYGVIITDEIYTTTIQMMQRQATAEINALKAELNAINEALNNLYEALSESLTDLGMASMSTMSGDDTQSAADKINSITSMVNTLSSSYNRTNDRMRDTIAKIDLALGYGTEVRYDGKLVKVASNTGYVENGLPSTIYYIFNDGNIVYLEDNDGIFEAVTDDTAYKATFDAILTTNKANAVNCISITDAVNGFRTNDNDPYTEYGRAIKAFLNAFCEYSDNTDVLIATVNGICGTEIAIPGAGAATEEISDSIKECLQAVNTELADLNSKNNVYATQYAQAATTLNEFLAEFNGGQNVAVVSVSEGVASLISISDDASVKYLNITADSTVTPVNDAEGVLTGVKIDGRDYYVKDNKDGTYTVMCIAADDAAAITRAARACVAELGVVRDKLDDVDNALEGLYGALNNAFTQMGLSALYADGDDTEESAADKINSISGMISIITNSYNSLQREYGELASNYQAILDSIYGEGEKSASDVTPSQIAAQLEKNKKDAIDLAVAEALEQSGNISADIINLQRDIAEAILAAKEGDAYDTTGMSSETIAALNMISDMRSELDSLNGQVTALQSGNEAITSMLSTLSTALGFEDVQDQANIIAAIQSLKDQVSALTAANQTLIDEKAALVKENSELKAENSTLKASGAKSSTSLELQEYYNAGYSAGYTAAGNDHSLNEADYESGYNAGYTDASKNQAADADTYRNGYNAGYNAAALDISASSGTDGLNAQITSLTLANNALAGTVSAYEEGIDELYDSVLLTGVLADQGRTLSSGGSTTTYVGKLNKVKNYYSLLMQGYTSKCDENSTLAEKNDSLSNSNKTLKTKNQSLNEKNEKLSEKNDSLKTSNSELKEQVVSLQGENTELKQKKKNTTTPVYITVTPEPTPTEEPVVEPEEPEIIITLAPTEAPATPEPTRPVQPINLPTEEPEEPTPTGANVYDPNETPAVQPTEEDSSNALSLVIVIIVVVIAVFVVIFFLVIKPRMAGGKEDDEEDGDEDDDEDDETA